MSRAEEEGQEDKRGEDALRKALALSRHDYQAYRDGGLRAPDFRTNLEALHQAVAEALTLGALPKSEGEVARAEGYQAGRRDGYAEVARDGKKAYEDAARKAYAEGFEDGRKARPVENVELPFHRPASFDFEDKQRKLRVFIRIQDAED
jgi:hypothetical protein